MSAMVSTGSCHLIEETVSNVSLMLAKTFMRFYFSTLSGQQHSTLTAIQELFLYKVSKSWF